MPRDYLASRVSALKPSGIRKFFDIAATMQDVVSLGIGEPDFTTPRPIIDAGIRAFEKGETHYTSNAGILPLREAIAEDLQRRYQVQYDPAKEILITVGVSEALYLAFSAILDPGDEVIITTPCFVSYAPEIIMAGGTVVEVPTTYENNFDIEPEAIARAITPRTKAILVGFPNNPTGAVASRAALIEVAKLAQQHDLIVVSDEIYESLVYGVEHVCFPGIADMRQRTILLGGFSKAYAMTGWRIGYAAAPEYILRGL